VVAKLLDFHQGSIPSRLHILRTMRRRSLEVTIVAGTAQVTYSAQARDGKLALRHTCHRYDDGVDGFALADTSPRRGSMASSSNLDSMSRKPACPITCQGAVIRPPRPGAHSCRTGIWDWYNRSWRSRSAIGQASCPRPRMVRASRPRRHQGAGDIAALARVSVRLAI
jgi:hypothetical protein